MKTEKYYKIVVLRNKKLKSPCRQSNYGGIRYIKNKWVYPKKKYPQWLCVFDDLDDAIIFCNTHLYFGCGINFRSRIYECKIGDVVTPENCLIPFQKGTVFADKVMITKRVK